MISAVPQHSGAFRFRRVMNWFPLGLAYAFLYMGRYNLTVAKNALGDLMTKADFGEIFSIGAIVYGIAFVINGPLTDRVGGRKSMLIGVAGATVMNALMGLEIYGVSQLGWNLPIVPTFMVLFAGNMYFQSFGAVAIVSTKAPWFHVRERGTFSTIFGVMISMGVYFAFDWGSAIVQATRATVGELGAVATFVRWILPENELARGVDLNWWLFFIPSIALSAMWIILWRFLRNTPQEAGFTDFDTGEESMSDNGERLPASQIFLRIIKHPVLMVICGIAVANGVLKNGVMNWYPIYAKEVGLKFFITQNWGLVMLIAGVGGSMLTGWTSDRFFGSKRAPMTAILYGGMIIATITMYFSLDSNPWVMGACVFYLSGSFLGIHGILSGTSTIDFGGRKNAGAAVGIIDGLVYLGTGFQNLAAGYTTPTGDAAKDPSQWSGWPALMIPFAIVGFVLAVRIWSAMPKGRVTTPAAPATQPLPSAHSDGNNSPDPALPASAHQVPPRA